MVPPTALVRTPPLPTVTPPEMLPELVSVPTSVSVPSSVSDAPAAIVFAPVSSHDAPLSTVTDPKLVKLVPRPLNVPALPPEASSSALLALVLPLILPLKTAPGSTTSRLLPVPPR